MGENPISSAEKASQARERGNDLYKAGKLPEGAYLTLTKSSIADVNK